MITTRFRLDVTGCSREDLRDVFESHFTYYRQSEKQDSELNMTYCFSKDETDKWEIHPNAKLFGQQPASNNKGRYNTGGIDYKSTIISPRITTDDIEMISGITDLIESKSRAITNKTCHFSLTVDAKNLSEKQFFNIVLEIAFCENYLKKLTFLRDDFSVLSLELLDNINSLRDIEKLIDYLMMKENGLFYRDNQLIFDYIKPAITLETALQMETLTMLLLNIIDKAVNQKAWLAVKQMSEENEKFSFRTYMVRLGMKGEESKRYRKLILDELTGNSAWRNHRQIAKELDT